MHQSIKFVFNVLRSWLLRFMAATCLDLQIVLISLLRLRQRCFGLCPMDFKRLYICVCDGLDIWCVHGGCGLSTRGACYKVCGREKSIAR